MTVPTISNLPTVPATSDPNFETEAPALFNHIKNTFVSEMNSAISFINSSTFDATVEFKNASFTAAKNFLYMIDTTSGAVTVTLPASPATGDQLLLMDQKRYFATNNLTISRNGKNINGSASDVVSKSTGALIRCVYNSTYGWTVDLYEGQWESGTSAGDLVYNGGKVGIGTSAPSGKLDVNTGVMSGDVKIGNFDNVNNGTGSNTHLTQGTKLEFIADTNPRYSNHNTNTVAFVKAEYDGSDSSADVRTGNTALTFATHSGFADSGTLSEKMRISSFGNVGIGTNSPAKPLDVRASQNGLARFYSTSPGGDCEIELLTLNSASTVGKLSKISATQVGADTNGSILNFSTSPTTSNTPTTRMTIDSSGNVGIGTSSPQGTLNIKGSSASLVLSDDDTAADVAAKLSVDGGRGKLELFRNGASYKTMLWDSGSKSYLDNTAGADLVLQSSGGNVEISTGNLVIGTSGKGIDFGVASGSVTSQLLNDYEEGTFEPYLLGATTAGSFTYSLQLGRYTKIGNMVQFQITLATSATATAPAGDITIRGLPFTSKSTASVFGSASIGWTQNITGGADLGAYVINNNTYIALRNITDGSGNMLQGSAVGSTFYFLITGTYQT